MVKRVSTYFGALILAGLCWGAGGANTIRKAPELAFTVPGQGPKLLSQYRGKVVALEFILTTCPHCQAAVPVMGKFQEEYGNRGFQALDVAINGLDDGRGPHDADLLVAAFARTFRAEFPVGWVPRDQMVTFLGFSMADRMVVPQLVLIDRKGYIHYQTPPLGDENSMKEETIRQRIEELLALGNSSSRTTLGKSRAAVAKKSP